MKNKNVFEKNAKIPDIVQQKANAAFADIYNRQDEPVEKPQKTYRLTGATIIKIAAGAVAAAMTIAVVFVALAKFGGQVKDPGQVQSQEPGQSQVQSQSQDQGQDIGQGQGQVTEFLSGGEQFTIKVCTAALKPETPLPISLDVSEQAFGYYIDWTGCADYQINFPISVEGENISAVTFKAENAVFEVVSIDCPSIVKSGSPVTLDDFNSTYVEGYDMSGHPIGKTEVGYYDSFSADYDTLQNSNYLINICNVLTDRMDLYHLLVYEGNDYDYCAAYTYLLKDARITIEVTFTDGTTASRSLGLFADQILTTDTSLDGIEYTYEAMQVFCFDPDYADDATKQLIGGQLTRAMEIIKIEEANFTGFDDAAYDDDPVDDADTPDGKEGT